MRRVTIALCLFFSGCARPLPRAAAVWSGTVELASGENVSFELHLDLTSHSGYFIVGGERTAVPEIFQSGQTLNLNFSEYGAEMRGTWDGRVWSGVYLRHRAAGTKAFKFSASPDRGTAAVLPMELPVGNFQVRFEGEDTEKADTAAKFWKDGDALRGTLIAPEGDYGLLEARSDGGRLQLHRFTGWQATLIDLEPVGGAWTGMFYAASNDKPRRFTLQPRADLQVKSSASDRTRMKNPDAPFAFACAAPTGRIVRNTDSRFKGKPTIVDVMGTWCHNCLDEAPVLQQLQTQFGKDGLEIIGLSFEIQNDADAARKNLQLFKDRFGLTYTLLFCGDLDEANTDRKLKNQIENFFAYQTSLFIDRSGKVQTVHSGFKGPGTGDEFKAQIGEFHELVSRIIQ